MTFQEYQEGAANTAKYRENIYKDLPLTIDNFLAVSYCTLGLAGEAAEVANKVKKIQRDDKFELTPAKILEIKGEIGGCLWYLAALCSELGITLDSAAEYNLEQLSDRKKRGVISGSGDFR